MPCFAPIVTTILLFAKTTWIQAAHLRAADPLLCLDAGDMCIPRGHMASPRVLMTQLWEPLKLSSTQGCSSSLSGEEKLMLMPIVPKYHGSTVLESVFMSSPSLATLCTAHTWQCEVFFDEFQ